MLRYTSWIYRFQLNVKGQKIGSPIPIAISGYTEPRRGNYYDRSLENVEVWG
jgi:hypothetical protein